MTTTTVTDGNINISLDAGATLMLGGSNDLISMAGSATIEMQGGVNNSLTLGGTAGNVSFSLAANGQDLTINDYANGSVVTLIGEFTNGAIGVSTIYMTGLGNTFEIYGANQTITMTTQQGFIYALSGATVTDAGQYNLAFMSNGSFSQSGTGIFDGVSGDNNVLWASSDNGGISVNGNNDIVHVTSQQMWVETTGSVGSVQVLMEADNINTVVHGDGNVITETGFNDGLVLYGDNTAITQTGDGSNSYIFGNNNTVTVTASDTGVTVRDGTGTEVHVLATDVGVKTTNTGGPIEIYMDAGNIETGVDGAGNFVTINGDGDQVDLWANNETVTSNHAGTVITFHNGSVGNTLDLGGTAGNITFSLAANGQDLTITDYANGSQVTLLGEFAGNTPGVTTINMSGLGNSFELYGANQTITLSGTQGFIYALSGAMVTDQGQYNLAFMSNGSFSQSGIGIFDGVSGDNDVLWASSDNGGISVNGNNDIVHVTSQQMWVETTGSVGSVQVLMEADNINTVVHGDGNVITETGFNDGLVLYGDNTAITQTGGNSNSYIFGDNDVVTDSASDTGVTIRSGTGTVVHMLSTDSGVSNYGGGPVQINLDADNIHVGVNGDGTTNQIMINGAGDQLDLSESNQAVTAFHNAIISFYGGSSGNSLTLGGAFTSVNAAFSLSANGQDLLINDGVAGDQIKLVGEFAYSAAGVSSVHFSDGTTLTSDQIVALIGTSPH